MIEYYNFILTWPTRFGVFVSQFFRLFQCFNTRHRRKHFPASSFYNIYKTVGLNILRQCRKSIAIEYSVFLRSWDTKFILLFNKKVDNSLKTELWTINISWSVLSSCFNWLRTPTRYTQIHIRSQRPWFAR